MFREPRKRKVSRRVWKALRLVVVVLGSIPFLVVLHRFPDGVPYGDGLGAFDIAWPLVLALYWTGVWTVADDVIDFLFGPLDPESPQEPTGG